MITYTTDKLQKVLLSGGCEQNGTPSPTQPLDIITNNGAIKVSKNLLNNPNYIKGLINDDGILNSTYDTCTLDYYPVEPNTTYTFSFIKQRDIQYDRLCEYSSNDESSFLNLAVNQSNIDTVAIGGTVIMTFTTTANTHYIRASLICSYAYKDGLPEKAQLEIGTTVTPYMPYGQIYTDGTQEVVTDNLGNTANAERLLAVGGYKDTQEVLNGSVTRKVGIYVLDGTEDWQMGQTFYIDNLFGYATVGDKTPFCTHYKGVDGNVTASDCLNTNSIRLYTATSVFRLNIFAVMSDYANVNAFKQFLADQYINGTPVIIAYPLATATTETVSAQFLSKSPVTQTAGSIDNLPIETSTIVELKKRYIGDKEVKRVYIEDNLVYKQ